MPSFVHPMFLWALPLGLVPIIIYYLMRFRSLKVTWGANYVLERALARIKKQLFLDQLLLLILRVLAALALVFAFARPTAREQGDQISGSGVHHVVVVDMSYSLDAAVGERTRRDLALDMLRELVGSWGRGERWSLVALGAEPRWLVDDAVVSKPADTVARLAELPAGEETAVQLAPALAAILAKVGDQKVELYVVTDDQAAAWEDVAAVPLPASVPRYWLCPPLDQHANLAVTKVRIGHQRILAGHPTRAFAWVRNYGAEAVRDAEVEFLVDGAFYGKETLSLLPGQEGRVALDVSIDAAGPHSVTARVAKDVLPADNSFSVGVDVAETLRVLVLREAGRDAKFQSAAGFLDLAAQVMTRKDEDGAPLFTAAPFTVATNEGELDPEALSAADVVVLDAGRSVTPDLAALLRSYVEAGGGLLLAPDDTVDRDAWNRELGPAGLLPAPLAGARSEALGGDSYRALALSGFGTPALRSFESRENGDLGRVRFYSWLEFGAPAPGVEVLASFGDGAPYALQQRGELGTVTLLASGLNGRTNGLIVSESFFPFLTHLLADTASGAQYPRTVDRGGAARLRLPAGDTLKGATFALQNAAPESLTPRPQPDGSLLLAAAPTARTGLASMLLVRDSGSERVWYGIQGPRPDSDLTPLTEAERNALITGQRFQFAANADELKAALSAARRGSEWHAWVIVALLAFLLGEMVLQRRFI